MPITTFGIGAAVTPTVVKTTFSHYTNRKPRAKKPTAHISYDQGLHLVQSFLLYASHHTVEDVQAFTSQWVPHPTWTRIEDVIIPQENITKAAELLIAQLGTDGVEAIGGSKWWQWRRKNADLKAEWIEMRADYNQRQREKKKCRRIMFYVHGGGYFFGSVDEHRYQLQRHARKLNARVFAPRYRLAPQFPFPCGLLDCLAAYQHLLTIHDPTEIIFAGDSAGGGMILSLMCILRDQGAPLPAGAILISPWVDLTHSFPSLTRDDGLDYIPAHGFMQRPSRSWPVPNEEELKELFKASKIKDTELSKEDSLDDSPAIQRAESAEAEHIVRKRQPPLSVELDGKRVTITDQIQMYTTNDLITHPLVSPALQPSLGGLPPMLVMVGGGERLRDEQIYIAHKAANPTKYKLPKQWSDLYDPDGTLYQKYKPTAVQLQVWEDLCHVTPTLSFTRPAKYMYRSVAQFGAWALSRAQHRTIEITGDEDSSSESSEDEEKESKSAKAGALNGKHGSTPLHTQIGKAGDPLPPFRDHMIRELVNRHGEVYILPPVSDLPAMQMQNDLLGVVKEGPIRAWMNAKQEWDTKYASTKKRVHKQRLQAVNQAKPHPFGDDERPPPSALAGRQQDEALYSKTQRLKKSWGLGMWSSWSWKHDERTIQKENEQVESGEEEKIPTTDSDNVEKSKPDEQKDRSTLAPPKPSGRDRSTSRTSGRSRRKTVTASSEGIIEDDPWSVPEIPKAAAQEMTVPTTEPEQASPAIAAVSPAIQRDSIDTAAQPPVFIPKWKNANHLRDDSKVDDASSLYSRSSRIIPDNASTRAVFSAAGVQKSGPDADIDAETPTIADNLGGYDTPESRRSVERLQRHQGDADSRSIQSSLLTSALESVRGQPLRSPSAMAVVQSEGVIDLVESTESAELVKTIEPAKTSAVAQEQSNGDVPDGLVIATNAVQHDEDDGEKTPTAEKRPAMYDRQDSEFVTAHENL